MEAFFTAIGFLTCAVIAAAICVFAWKKFWNFVSDASDTYNAKRELRFAQNKIADLEKQVAELRALLAGRE